MNDFYTVHEFQSAGSSLSCIILFNKTHAIFEGHFPQQPVVPGVCMIQAVKELLQRHLDRALVMRSTGQVKFLRLITPDVTPEVSISWKEQENGLLVTALFKKDADLFKLTGNFETL